MKKNIFVLTILFYFLGSWSVWAWPTLTEKNAIREYWKSAKPGVSELCRMYGKYDFNGKTGRYTCGESTRVLGGFLKAQGHDRKPAYSLQDDHTFLIHEEREEYGEEDKKIITYIDPTYKQFLFDQIEIDPSKTSLVEELDDVFVGTFEELKLIFTKVTGETDHYLLRVWSHTWNYEDSFPHELVKNLQATLKQIDIFCHWHKKTLTPSFRCTQLHNMITF